MTVLDVILRPMHPGDSDACMMELVELGTYMLELGTYMQKMFVYSHLMND